MHDQPIQLDASFDTMPHYTVSSWLRTIDSRVVSGEPIAIIDDGQTQRVVTAPCTGRIVDIYTEVGAHILPRTIIGMVRPDLIMPEINHGIGSIITGIIMIALALFAIPFFATMSAPTNTNEWANIITTPVPTSTTDGADTNTIQDNPDYAMPDAPLPGTSPNDEGTSPDQEANDGVLPENPDDSSSDQSDPNSVVATPEAIEIPSSPTDTTQPNESDASTTDANQDTSTIDVNPDASDETTNQTDQDETIVDDSNTNTDFTAPDDDTTNPLVGRLDNATIYQLFFQNITELIGITQGAQSSLPNGVMSQADYDMHIQYAATRVPEIISELDIVISNNRDNPDLNEENRQWFTALSNARIDCLTIYATIQEAVAKQQNIPDMTSRFKGCYALQENFN